MVRLVVKRDDEVQFLFETKTTEKLENITPIVASIFNGRLKVQLLCEELSELREHGAWFPLKTVSLSPDQLEDLELRETQAEMCVPSGGYELQPDPLDRRNGLAPKPNMRDVLRRAAAEARAIVDKAQADAGVALTQRMVTEAVSILRGAVTIVYPAGLPEHDLVRAELENRPQLSTRQPDQLEVDPDLAQLWFAGKEMLREKVLADFVGKNEKSKVIVKLQNMGLGTPARSLR